MVRQQFQPHPKFAFSNQFCGFWEGGRQLRRRKIFRGEGESAAGTLLLAASPLGDQWHLTPGKRPHGSTTVFSYIQILRSATEAAHD
jgi:hypothetical protein